MKVLRDYQGLSVRLSDERLAHILEHPEMGGLEAAIEMTLAQPERVVESFSDPDVRLYYRFFAGTAVGDKHLCVIVKQTGRDPFIVTAYLTDKVKRGVLIWPKER